MAVLRGQTVTLAATLSDVNLEKVSVWSYDTSPLVVDVSLCLTSLSLSLSLCYCCLRKRAAPVWIHGLGFAPQGSETCVTTFVLSELLYRGSQMFSSEALESAADC